MTQTHARSTQTNTNALRATSDAPEFAEVHEEVVRTVDEGKAGTAPSAALRRELERMDQKEKTKIRMLEAQLEAWRNSGVHALGMETLVDMCPLPTDHQHQFEPQSLAVIIGPDNFAFQMTYKEIVIGRQSSEGDVDIDLSIFPHTSAVSRWHCTIKLKHDSFFYCYNKGKRPVFLNGVRISTNGKRQMGYESLLQICGVDLRFIANIPLLHDLFST
ncbi:hypothetical protein PTSG_08184 [Salpingoeca rosetta]|uniref:FHA domain-containing protein n=1 Tax=Salpingoeca rosetta (strain ATCC 50818 / BSB-021) TaxID=946362 RepID=F2UI88_SALR5|nr:uncharacterized protein PTSG_08184 [Salpingoeca rosetta]EGD76837.1 hypothetical protein PTSG_08184 [Salpingoeca rosetta]|eukprot:XP_004991209.1 hypothetical protein PTSG_08184 [Salpingoeca rosetta]